jgi:hypothetical protein
VRTSPDSKLEEKTERIQKHPNEAKSKLEKDQTHKWQSKMKELETMKKRNGNGTSISSENIRLRSEMSLLRMEEQD